MGPEGIEEFCELKSVSLDSATADWYKARMARLGHSGD